MIKQNGKSETSPTDSTLEQTHNGILHRSSWRLTENHSQSLLWPCNGEGEVHLETIPEKPLPVAVTLQEKRRTRKGTAHQETNH